MLTTGVHAIIDGCDSAISAMCYACLSTTQVAFGTMEGSVWLLNLHQSGFELKKVAFIEVPFPNVASTVQLLSHDAEIRGVDWSRDNSLLLSCSINGCVCLTQVEQAHVCRKWIANTRTTCCKCDLCISDTNPDLTLSRFHPLNQNMVIVGGGGSIYVFNCSTGAQVQCLTPIPAPTTYITGLTHSFYLTLFVRWWQRWCARGLICLWATLWECSVCFG